LVEVTLPPAAYENITKFYQNAILNPKWRTQIIFQTVSASD